MEKPGLIFVSSNDIHQDQVINITKATLSLLSQILEIVLLHPDKNLLKTLTDSREAEEALATADETSSNAMGKATGADQRWESSE